MFKTNVERSHRAKRSDITSSWVLIGSLLISGVFGLLGNFATNNSLSIISDCLRTTCSTSLVKDLQNHSSNLVQNFDVELNLKSRIRTLKDKPEPPQQFTPSAIGVITWTSRPGGKTYVSIPMRFGSDQSFGYLSKNLKTLNSIRVQVISGQQFYIYLNGEIAYTHRYQLPVFYSDPATLIQAPTLNSDYISKITVIKSLIYRQDVNLQRLANLFFILFTIFLACFFCLLLFRKFHFHQERVVIAEKIRVGAILGIWMISVTAWVMGPSDPTGGLNPGLFGPMGAAFSDYFQITQASHFRQPYNFSAVNYPPFALALLKGLSYPFPGFLGLAVIVAACLGVLFFMLLETSWRYKSRVRLKNILIFLTAYPLLFGIVRGNIDMLAVSLVWVSILMRNSKFAIFPAIFLACAISLKVWPIVFIFFFIRWGKKNIVFFAVGLSLVLIFISPFFLGYQNISQIIHVTFLSLSSSTAVATEAFHYTFSISSLFYFGHIFLLSANPIHPTLTDLSNSLSFTNSGTVKVLIGLIVLVLIKMIWKSKSISRSYLFCAGLALLISTPTFTYRGVILVAYFYFVWQESAERKESRKPSEKPDLTCNIDERGNREARMRRVREFVWLPLLAPTTYLFFGHGFKDDQLSLASILQPGCLVALLVIEIFLSRSENEEQSFETIVDSPLTNFPSGIASHD